MINLDIETCVVDQVETRRFRWSLTAPSELTQLSEESFATKREAAIAGKIMLLRALDRGCISPKGGRRSFPSTSPAANSVDDPS